MKLAGLEVLIWVIIAIVVAVVQGWKQVQERTGGEDEEQDVPPPVPRPRQHPGRSAQPQGPRSTPPPVTRAEPETWSVDQRRADEFRRRLSERLHAKVASPPPIVEVVVPEEPPIEEPQRIKRRTAATVSVRTSTALAKKIRQPATAREFIIGAEILGPPVSMRKPQ